MGRSHSAGALRSSAESRGGERQANSSAASSWSRSVSSTGLRLRVEKMVQQELEKVVRPLEDQLRNEVALRKSAEAVAKAAGLRLPTPPNSGMKLAPLPTPPNSAAKALPTPPLSMPEGAQG